MATNGTRGNGKATKTTVPTTPAPRLVHSAYLDSVALMKSLGIVEEILREHDSLCTLYSNAISELRGVADNLAGHAAEADAQRDGVRAVLPEARTVEPDPGERLLELLPEAAISALVKATELDQQGDATAAVGGDAAADKLYGASKTLWELAYRYTTDQPKDKARRA